VYVFMVESIVLWRAAAGAVRSDTTKQLPAASVCCGNSLARCRRTRPAHSPGILARHPRPASSSGILARCDHPLSLGPLEGTNNKIKTLNRPYYGLRDREFFTLKLHQLHEAKNALAG
jgi:hypothetical protein